MENEIHRFIWFNIGLTSTSFLERKSTTNGVFYILSGSLIALGTNGLVNLAIWRK